MPSGLYGIEHTNRKDEEHWTKNCFNSSFPASLAGYMMDNNIPAIYARLGIVNGELKIVCDEIPIRELFRCGNLHANELEYDFESKFAPYEQYTFGNLDPIDLVVKNINGEYLAPVEVKLTVLPTSATATKPEDEWGCELVVRTATTSYCALGIWDQVKDHRDAVRDIFEDVCSDIGMWTNDFEMSHKTANLRTVLNTFEREFINHQKPLVLQPFWKTQGQTPRLSDNAFDIVVWSDFAFSRLFIETVDAEKMSRPMRATARMARCLWELSKSGRIQIQNIYREMAFGQQTDKELSVPGDRWRKYITTQRVVTPILPRYTVDYIIQPGYIDLLKPERRFDQTLYFETQILNDQDDDDS